MVSIPASVPTASSRIGVPRRTVVTAGVWAAPAISLTTAGPAFANASGQVRVSLAGPTGGVPATGTVPLTVSVVDPSGVPLAGQAVSLAGPASATFVSKSGVTDGVGRFSTSFSLDTPWITPGTVVTITATSGEVSTSQPLTVLGADMLASGVNAHAQLGTGTAGVVAVPVQTSRVFPSPVASVVGGIGFSFALLEDGSVWGTGQNGNCQLGLGDTSDRSTWARLSLPKAATQIAATDASGYALLSDGTVWGWGPNASGRLGTGDQITARVPVRVPNVSGITQIAAGGAYLAVLDANKTVWMCGWNVSGELGTGDKRDCFSMTNVSGISNVDQLAAGYHFVLARVGDKVWAWGANDCGQLGVGDQTERLHPVQIPSLSGVVSVAASADAGFAVLSSGQALSWGRNENGQLGQGDAADVTTPERSVLSPKNMPYSNVASLVGTNNGGAATLADGSVHVWGRNDLGQCGDGTTDSPRAWGVTPKSTNSPYAAVLNSPYGSSTTQGLFLKTASRATTIEIVGNRVSAGQPITVNVRLQAGSSALSNAAVSVAATGGAVVAQPTGVTGVNGVFSTTVTPGAWTKPGSTISVTASSDGGDASGTFIVLGSNLLVSGANDTGQLGIGATSAVSAPVLSSPVFPADVEQVVGGRGFSLALLADGTVWSTGANGAGQLGVGDTTSRTTWVPVTLPKTATSLAATDASSYALLSDGTVWGWGSNGSGRLGTGDQTATTTPIHVPNVSGVQQIAAGGSFLAALDANGDVWTCGWNVSGELGTGDKNDRQTLTKVDGLSGVAQIAAGYHFVLARVGDKVWAWGANDCGQIGDGTQTGRLRPTQITSLSGIAKIAAGGDAGFAIDTAGNAFAWGRNDVGQLGSGDAHDVTTPELSVLTPRTMSQFSDVVSLVGLKQGGIATTAAGKVWTWGANDAGQCGDGTTDSPRAWPVEPKSDTPFSRVLTGSSATGAGLFLASADHGMTVDVVDAAIAAGTSGTVDAKIVAGSAAVADAEVTFTATAGVTFDTSIGRTGPNGVFSTTVTPGQWITPGTVVTVTASSEAGSGTDTFTVLGSDVMVSGLNDHGQLGTGSSSIVSTPVQSSTVLPSPVRSVAGGINASFALLEDGSVWGVGENGGGQLGVGDTTSRSTWVKVPLPKTATQISAAEMGGYALLSDGTVWGWGGNDGGRLGTGDTVGSKMPIRVPNVSGIAQIASGGVYLAVLDSNKTVWMCGWNVAGELGTGDTRDRWSMTNVSGISNVDQIAAGYHFMLARVGDTVWAWGANDCGQLGMGDQKNRPHPVQIPGLSGVVSIATAADSSFAVLSSGQSLSWGRNEVGQLGQGDAADVTTPERSVLTPKNMPFSNVASLVGMNNGGAVTLTDGSVHVWGRNDAGQCGDGTTDSPRAWSVTPSTKNSPYSAVLNSPYGTATNRGLFLRAMGRATSVTVSPRAVSAGSDAAVAVSVVAGSQPVAGAAVSLTTSGGARLAQSSGTTDASGSFTTTATPGQWTLPGTVITVTASSDAGSGAGSFSVLGSNVLATGINDHGQLGVGTTDPVSVPVQSSPVFPSPVKSVAGGVGFSFALLEDGSVWGAGRNDAGQLGLGDVQPRTTWAQLALPKAATQIAATDGSGYALLVDGTVWGWGSNGSGRIGIGNQDAVRTPVQVPNTAGVIQIAAGGAFLAVLDSGHTVWTCGWNVSGELGTGDKRDRYSLTPVSGLPNVDQIAAGYHFMVARVGDKVWVWGANDCGQMGLGDQTERLRPVQIPSLSNVVSVAASADAAFAVTSSGQALSWGRNENGQLGQGDAADVTTPEKSVLTPKNMPYSDVVSLVGTNNGGAVTLSDGSVRVWGRNDLGQCGDGTTDSPRAWGVIPKSTNSPYTAVLNSPYGSSTTQGLFLRAATRATSVDVAAPAVSAGTSEAVTVRVLAGIEPQPNAAVTVAASGGASLALASGTTDSNGSFATTVTPGDWTTPGTVVTVKATSLAGAGFDSFTVLGSDLLVSGRNTHGELGLGSTASVLTPTQSSRVFPAPIKSVAGGIGFSIAVLRDGSVWSCGQNNAGQLGLGDSTDRSTWAQVSLPKAATAVAATDGSGHALLVDGTVWSWGSNSSGRFGTGNQVGSTIPVVTKGVRSVTQMAAGGAFLAVLDANGDVWTCGWNVSGELGTGDRTDRFSLTKVNGLSRVDQISAGYHFMLARVGDKVWSWGANDCGQMGDGTQTSRLTPQQIPGLSGIVSIATAADAAFAVDATGRAKSWGRNEVGQLGQGDAADVTTPERSVLTPKDMPFDNVVNLVGMNHGGVVQLADGSFHAWGKNDVGQTGDGTADSPRGWSVQPSTANSRFSEIINSPYGSAACSGLFLRARR